LTLLLLLFASYYLIADLVRLSEAQRSETDRVLPRRNSGVRSAPIYSEITGSDHCPVGLEIEFPVDV
jgi:endonuclease/exonuclease/phosphatase family metal-dependent hydrolase